jgi:arginyl-tRNA synthetase
MSNPRQLLDQAVGEAIERLDTASKAVDPELGQARNPAHGDYQTTVAFKLAGPLRRPPPEIAVSLVEALELPGGMATAEAVGPFVNFRLSDDWLRRLVGQVAATGTAYGSSRMGAGRRVQVEFGSINPTGPIHVGHGRGSILGDALARLLAFTGHSVEREYYVNDYNLQALKFGQSIYARLHGTEPSPGGYVGDYVNVLAEAARRDIPGVDDLAEAEAVERLREYGSWQVIEESRATLKRLGITYDSWFSERTLWESGLAQAAIERLRENRQLVERDGALWFAPDLAGLEEDDEDRVVIRSDGTHTYFGSDLGYLLSRFEQRRFDEVVEVWATDHHGYVPRFKAGAAALGIAPDRLMVIVHQMVNLREGKMSKRQGRFVTLDELIDRVGSDAVRYFYLLRSPEAMMEFDLELAVSEGNENPVYYAQYAHARLANVEPTAAEKHPDLPDQADLSLIVEPWELDLARQVARWPETVEEAARLREPHRIPYYTQALADRIHNFYQAGNRDWRHRVVVDDPGLTRARLELSRAARHTLRSALDLMGVDAPDRM